MRFGIVLIGWLFVGCGADRLEQARDGGSGGIGGSGAGGRGGVGVGGRGGAGVGGAGTEGAAGEGVITSCPTDGRPIANRACSGPLMCELGKESCCGQTYSSGWCGCSGGVFVCSYTDACYGGGSCGWRPDASAPPDASPPDAGPARDAGAPRDAWADAGADGVCDGSTSVATACAMPLPAGSFGTHCIEPYSAVETDRSWCGSTITTFVARCGGYDAYEAQNVDVSHAYYYDAANGRLIAIFYRSVLGGVDRARCVAGPRGFSPPPCQPHRALRQCP